MRLPGPGIPPLSIAHPSVPGNPLSRPLLWAPSLTSLPGQALLPLAPGIFPFVLCELVNVAHAPHQPLSHLGAAPCLAPAPISPGPADCPFSAAGPRYLFTQVCLLLALGVPAKAEAPPLPVLQQSFREDSYVNVFLSPVPPPSLVPWLPGGRPDHPYSTGS